MNVQQPLAITTEDSVLPIARSHDSTPYTLSVFPSAQSQHPVSSRNVPLLFAAPQNDQRTPINEVVFSKAPPSPSDVIDDISDIFDRLSLFTEPQQEQPPLPASNDSAEDETDCAPAKDARDTASPVPPPVDGNSDEAAVDDTPLDIAWLFDETPSEQLFFPPTPNVLSVHVPGGSSDKETTSARSDRRYRELSPTSMREPHNPAREDRSVSPHAASHDFPVMSDARFILISRNNQTDPTTITTNTPFIKSFVLSSPIATRGDNDEGYASDTQVKGSKNDVSKAASKRKKRKQNTRQPFNNDQGVGIKKAPKSPWDFRDFGQLITMCFGTRRRRI